MPLLLKLQRASTREPIFIDPDRVSMVMALRTNIVRIYLSEEAHFVDVEGALERIAARIQGEQE